MISESRSNGKLINRSAACPRWDPTMCRYIREVEVSYDWTYNEVGGFNGNRLSFTIISMDGEPDYFKGFTWRSFVHKYSDNEIGTGLEVSKNGESFRPYGESKARRIQ